MVTPSSSPLPDTAIAARPILRFDTMGSPAHVLHDAETHAPQLFGVSPRFIHDSLERLVRNYAPNEKWTVIVLSISTGMARPELTEMFSRRFAHQGPIIIDPDLGTPGHHLYMSQGHARIHLERLIEANEMTHGLMVVMYAFTNITHDFDNMRMAVHKLRMATLTMEQLAAAQELILTFSELYDVLALKQSLYDVKGQLEHITQKFESLARQPATVPPVPLHVQLAPVIGALHVIQQAYARSPGPLAASLHGLVRQLERLPQQIPQLALPAHHAMAIQLRALAEPAAKAAMAMPGQMLPLAMAKETAPAQSFLMRLIAPVVAQIRQAVEKIAVTPAAFIQPAAALVLKEAGRPAQPAVAPSIPVEAKVMLQVTPAVAIDIPVAAVNTANAENKNMATSAPSVTGATEQAPPATPETGVTKAEATEEEQAKPRPAPEEPAQQEEPQNELTNEAKQPEEEEQPQRRQQEERREEEKEEKEEEETLAEENRPAAQSREEERREEQEKPVQEAKPEQREEEPSRPEPEKIGGTEEAKARAAPTEPNAEKPEELEETGLKTQRFEEYSRAEPAAGPMRAEEFAEEKVIKNIRLVAEDDRTSRPIQGYQPDHAAAEEKRANQAGVFIPPEHPGLAGEEGIAPSVSQPQHPLFHTPKHNDDMPKAEPKN